MKKITIWICSLAASLTWTCAQANEFPSKLLRLVVPFPAGGTADVLPRILSEKLRTRFPAGVIVENKPGAGGNIGAEFVSYTHLTLPTSDLV